MTVVLSGLLGGAVGPSVSAEPYLSEQKAELAVGVQFAIFNDDFGRADSLGEVLSKRFPNDPIGPFCRAASLLGEMFDREEVINPERFFGWLDEADSLAAIESDTIPSDRVAWMAFYRGHGRSYRALWESHFGSSLRAIRLARAARAEYESGLRADSSCYDLYLGLGLYHYWKSAKGGLLRRLRILKNEMARGVDELRLAADSSAISREAARNSLIWVWLDQKKYDSVVTVSRAMAQRFPAGKLFLWPLAKGCFEAEDYDRAVEVYRELRSKLANEPGNYYNLIECDYQLYRCYDKLEKDDEVRSVARRVVSYVDSVPPETGRRQRSELSFLVRAARR